MAKKNTNLSNFESDLKNHHFHVFRMRPKCDLISAARKDPEARLRLQILHKI